MTKRILSGIKPTGEVHLGSYLGAMKQWPKFQGPDAEVFYFIADLHALNARQESGVLKARSYDLVAWLLALGIDADNNPIFAQSQVPAHAELGWILNNYTTMGELSRMTQYKDKALKAGTEGQLVALFDYPVLMAADILLYDAAEVPVGDDQTQHVELTRDIAERFNNLYGDTLVLPKFVPPPAGARVMMLDDPTRKMSKSEVGEGCVYLTDSAEVITHKFSRAVTDSVGSINYDRETQPGISNLLEILAAIAGNSTSEQAQSWTGKSYAELKVATSQAVINELKPVQDKFQSIRQDTSQLDRVLEQGAQRANKIAILKLANIKQTIGLV